MFENFTLLAVVIVLFWLGIYIYYLYTSRQQQRIEAALKEVEKLLEEDTQ